MKDTPTHAPSFPKEPEGKDTWSPASGNGQREDYNLGCKFQEGRQPVGARSRDPLTRQVQRVVKEGFQEEVTSEVNPEGHLGMSQGKRKGKAEGRAGAKA